ncbi:phage portal protein family protein [Mycobacterium marinum]|uniref:phage portal protein family protein n=1 Tax=Mycobacterium marinum TaxID=1781 RepID=UPI00356501F1
MAEQELPAAPVVEKGYVNPFPGSMGMGFGQVDLFEDVQDMLWPNSVRTLTRMGRIDTRLYSMLQAIYLAVRTTKWWIEPNGARDEVVAHVAADLGLPIRGADESQPTPRSRGRFSWNRHLQTALKYLQFGHQVFERTFTIDDKGRAHLGRLSPRPSSTIAYWDVAANGDLLSIQQWPAGTLMAGGIGGQRVIGSAPMGRPIGADRLVVYVRDPDPGVWYGNSILRPCYGNWMLKAELIRIEAAAARRHGVGVPVINVGPKESQDPARMALYGKIAKEWTGGASSGAAFPEGTDSHIKGVEGTMPAGMIRQAIDYHDKAMAQAALMHFMNLDKGGSYALASIQEDPWIQATQAVANDIRDIGQAGVVEDIVDHNWGIDESVPLIGCDQIGKEATAAMLQMLVAAGIITPDSPLESFIRASAGLPAPDPKTEREQPTQQPSAKTPTNRIKVREHTRRSAGAPKDEQEPLF